MELKFTQMYTVLICVTVLIVPLWNWNYGVYGLYDGVGSFNRTFMELKYTKTYVIDSEFE